MALIHTSSYEPSVAFKSKHFNTIYRTLFHKIDMGFQRERMETSDGDFMDIDFSRVGSKRVVVIIHGLEGSSQSKYVTALGRISNEEGYIPSNFFKPYNMSAKVIAASGSSEPSRAEIWSTSEICLEY